MWDFTFSCKSVPAEQKQCRSKMRKLFLDMLTELINVSTEFELLHEVCHKNSDTLWGHVRRGIICCLLLLIDMYPTKWETSFQISSSHFTFQFIQYEDNEYSCTVLRTRSQQIVSFHQQKLTSRQVWGTGKIMYCVFPGYHLTFLPLWQALPLVFCNTSNSMGFQAERILIGQRGESGQGGSTREGGRQATAQTILHFATIVRICRPRVHENNHGQ